MAHITDHITQVALFHEVFKIGNKHTPNIDLPLSEYELRHRLFEEENNEYLDACKSENLTEVADALGDMLYIWAGTVLKHGLQYHIEAVFDEIQRSNMSKLDAQGQPIFREDGKVMKSTLYTPPNITSILNRPAIEVLRFNSGSEHFKTACTIREKVFVKEQEVAPEEEYDEYESTSVHYLAISDGKPLGTCRWRITEKGIKMERYAVLKEARGKGIGERLVRATLSDIRHLGRTIYLHAQLHAVPFYKREGFYEEPALFYEANIPHYKMIYGQTKE